MNEAATAGYTLQTATFHLVVQNCCLETWLLGNDRIFSRYPSGDQLKECLKHYSVLESDPELMDSPDDRSRVEFHLHYLRKMLEEKRMHYSKSKPKDVCSESYLAALRDRSVRTPDHLASFRHFINLMQTL